MESGPAAVDLRTRLAAALEAGKTVALSERELDDARLRAQLPQLLDELARARGDAVAPFRIPGYTVLGEIGQGGMSTVYLARQDALGRHVAVKLAPRWRGGGQRVVQRLRQEAHAMARLSHSNIVAIHDVLEVEDTVAIVMEWVDGRTLQSLLRSLTEAAPDSEVTALGDMLGATAEARSRFEATTMRFFVRLLHDVARATHAVHECGLLHLDIKPSNVLVRRDGTPLLADFGVVREIAEDVDQTRTFAGTPLYSAPEQLRRNDTAIGPRTDVYGLGMTLYEALARQQPLRGLDLPGILECVEGGRIPRLSSQVAVTADLENIVHKAIAPEPEHRYASAQELADDLLAFLEHRPVKARPLTRSQRLRRWMRNEPWKAGLAAALLVLVPSLLALGTYLLLQLPELQRVEEQRQLAIANGQRQEANRLRQEAYQDWLAHLTPRKHQFALLEQAVALDPDDTSLASLAFLQGVTHWALTQETLERHPQAVERHLGLRMVAARAAAGRSFFDDQELGRLRTSTDPIDQFVIALDRFFYSEDHANKEARMQAFTLLTGASFDRVADPMICGLLAYVARHARARHVSEAMLTTLADRWPEDIVAKSWAGIVREVDGDLDGARAVLEDLIRSAPDEPRPYALLARFASRRDDPTFAAETLERAAARGLESTALHATRLRIQARLARPEEELAFVAPISDPSAPLDWEIATILMPAHRKEQVRERLLTALSQDAPESQVLTIAMQWGLETRQMDLCDRAWECSSTVFPDRRALLIYRSWQLMLMRRPQQELSAVLAAFGSSGPDVPRILSAMAKSYVKDKNWPLVYKTAQQWLELCDDDADKPEPSGYAGLAAARMDRHDAAARHLGLALAVAPPAKASWFCSALLEDAILRAHPDSSSQIRDAALAARRMEQFDALNPLLDQPYASGWVEYARSLALFANGDRDGAIASAERGLRLRRPDLHVPDDWRARLEQALERFRQ